MDKETMKKEAVFRMQRLNLPRAVIEDFAKNDHIQMSAPNRIFLCAGLAPLDDEAQKAVAATMDYGMPYHVIKAPKNEDVITHVVLYVTRYEDQWFYERYNRKNKSMNANVCVCLPTIRYAEIKSVRVGKGFGSGLLFLKED